jgi:hypothetical protein
MATQDKYTYIEEQINEDDFVSEIKGKPYYNSPKMQEFFEANLSTFENNNAKQGFFSTLFTNENALKQSKQNAIKTLQNITSHLDNLSKNENFRKLPQKEQIQKYDEIAKQLSEAQNIKGIKATIDKIDKQKWVSVGITAGLGVAAGVTIASSFAALPVGAVVVGVGGGAIYGGAKILARKSDETAKIISEAPSNAITVAKILFQGKENVQNKEMLKNLIKNDTQITNIASEKVQNVITKLTLTNLEEKTAEILTTKQITVQNELIQKHPQHIEQIKECAECYKQVGGMQYAVKNPSTATLLTGIPKDVMKKELEKVENEADKIRQNLIDTLDQDSKTKAEDIAKVNELSETSRKLGEKVMAKEIKTLEMTNKNVTLNH